MLDKTFKGWRNVVRVINVFNSIGIVVKNDVREILYTYSIKTSGNKFLILEYLNNMLTKNS